MKLLMFPGQGSQKAGMGLDAYMAYRSARLVFEEVDNVLNFRLSDMIFNGNNIELTQTENAQVAIMTTSIAYLRAYEEETGEQLCNCDTIYTGHSLGEYSALCAAGVLSLADTAKLLWIRGNAMKECSNFKSGMAAILGLSLPEIEHLITDIQNKIPDNTVIQIANDNCNGQVVISGHKTALEVAIEQAKKAGAKRAIFLNVAGAFHSELMRPAAEKLSIALNKTIFKQPIGSILSSITTKIVSNGLKELLVHQLTSRVRWRETILAAEQLNIERAIEIGPDAVLTGLMKRIDTDIPTNNINSVEAIKNIGKI